MAFGMQDPRLNPMAGRPAWQSPGPVGAVQLTPGFRPPGAGGGGAPGMMPQQQGMPQMPMMPFGMVARPPGANEGQVNNTLDAAPAGAQGDPMAQGAAQAADMGGGSFMSWLKGLI